MGLVVLFVSLFLLFLGGAGYDYLHYLRGEMKYSAFFTAYNGLPFLISIGLFISFIKLKLKNKLWYGMAQLSPYVLGVYLIHDHVELRQWVWHFIPQTDFITSWSFLPVMIGYIVLQSFLFALASILFGPCWSERYVPKDIYHFSTPFCTVIGLFVF